MALSPTSSRAGIPNPVTTALNVTPPAGAVGEKITPASPNATGSNTTALEIDVPQSAAPNFPNIYALRVRDPDTSQVPFQVVSDGSVLINGQPFSVPLKVLAATSNPDTRVFYVVDGANATVLEVDTPSAIGFFGVTPVTQRTGVAVTAAGIHAALVSLGLITA